MHPTVPGVKDEKYLRNRIKNLSACWRTALSLTKSNKQFSEKLFKAFRTHPPPQVTSAWRPCRLLLLQWLLWATRPPLPWSSSRRSSCAVGAVSGSAAPLPPAAPPGPPSTRTRPPLGGARLRHASSLPPRPPQTAGREARRAKVGTGGVRQGFWAARILRIETGSGCSSGSEKVTRCPVVNQIH